VYNNKCLEEEHIVVNVIVTPFKWNIENCYCKS